MKNNTSNHPRYSVVAFASNGKVYGYAELICDEVADLDYLPTENTKIAVGSKCTCLANGKVYTLSNARQWVEDLSNQSDGTDEVYDPLEVSENGDVVVTYNGMKIAATEESGHITLETSGKRVEHDIELEYTKPQSGIPVGNIVNIVNNTSDNIDISGARSMVNLNGVISTITINSNTTNNGYIFCRSGESPSSYLITFNCESMTNKYNITTNSTPWAYDNSERLYYYEITNDQPINGQTYNIVVTNKE